MRRLTAMAILTAMTAAMLGGMAGWYLAAAGAA